MEIADRRKIDYETVRCPFCDSEKASLKRKVFSEVNRSEYKHYSCTVCGIEFFTPLVFENVYDTEVIAAYKDFHEGRSEYPDWTKTIVKFFDEKNIDLNEKKILEIGPGDGINFLALREKFKINAEDYFGVELDKKSIEVCKARGIMNVIDDYFDDRILEKIEQQFDIIIIAEVLEHQIRPGNFIKTAFQLLKQGGTMVVTVPNKKRFFLKHREYGDIPPHHFLRFDKDFFLKNYGKDIVYLNDYSFRNKSVRESGRALSMAALGNENYWILFVPVVLMLRVLDSICGEGIIAIIRK